MSNETITIQPYRPIPLCNFVWVLPWQKASFDEDSDIYRDLNAGRWWFGWLYETGETAAFSYDFTNDYYYNSGGIKMTPYYDQRCIVKLCKNIQKSLDQLKQPNPRKGFLGLPF